MRLEGEGAVTREYTDTRLSTRIVVRVLPARSWLLAVLRKCGGAAMTAAKEGKRWLTHTHHAPWES
jgi:hypothetical protein